MGSLNERRHTVLDWIAAGCPQREWPDYTYRATAKALQARGLVKVAPPRIHLGRGEDSGQSARRRVNGTPWPDRDRSRLFGGPRGTEFTSTSPRACR